MHCGCYWKTEDPRPRQIPRSLPIGHLLHRDALSFPIEKRGQYVQTCAKMFEEQVEARDDRFHEGRRNGLQRT